LESVFTAAKPPDRLHLAGTRTGEALADAYHAFDVFAFASQSETQGMVLAEAMTAGVPVVAIDAPGVREVVRDRQNGRLLETDDEHAFAAALAWLAALPDDERKNLSAAARATSESFSMPRCVDRLLQVYERLHRERRRQPPADDSLWATALRRIEEEWKIWSSLGAAVGAAIRGSDESADSAP
jgi:glycosyltransferase involved in cell wall biosynthesis